MVARTLDDCCQYMEWIYTFRLSIYGKGIALSRHNSFHCILFSASSIVLFPIVEQGLNSKIGYTSTRITVSFQWAPRPTQSRESVDWLCSKQETSLCRCVRDYFTICQQWHSYKDHKRVCLLVIVSVLCVPPGSSPTTPLCLAVMELFLPLLFYHKYLSLIVYTYTPPHLHPKQPPHRHHSLHPPHTTSSPSPTPPPRPFCTPPKKDQNVHPPHPHLLRLPTHQNPNHPLPRLPARAHIR